MRSYTAAFQAHLDSGTTTLCYCWRVTRADGVVLGFTDHDVDLTFQGTVFEAATGFSATQFEQNINLAADNLEVAGALNSASITEEDLVQGRYDSADVELFWVNWKDPTINAVLSRSTIGETTRNGIAFVAELRSLSQQLQQRTGRQFQRYCDTELGSDRCTVDLTLPAYQGEGIVQSVAGRVLTVSGLEGFADAWFSRGVIHFEGTSGSLDGLTASVKRFSNEGGVLEVEVWTVLGVPPTPGAAFFITAGCDKAISTCRTKFANHLNHQGFNLMPGSDAVTTYPTVGDSSQNGLSLFQ